MGLQQPDIVKRLDAWLASMGIVLLANEAGEFHHATGPQRDLIDARNEIVRLRSGSPADAEAVQKVREHVNKNADQRMAYFSVDGLRSVLAEHDRIKEELADLILDLRRAGIPVEEA
jgi:hypothetical protein